MSLWLCLALQMTRNCGCLCKSSSGICGAAWGHVSGRRLKAWSWHTRVISRRLHGRSKTSRWHLRLSRHCDGWLHWSWHAGVVSRRRHLLTGDLSSRAAAKIVARRREVRIRRTLPEVLRIILRHWHRSLHLLRRSSIIIIRVRQIFTLHVIVQSHLTGVTGFIRDVAFLSQLHQPVHDLALLRLDEVDVVGNDRVQDGSVLISLEYELITEDRLELSANFV